MNFRMNKIRNQNLQRPESDNYVQETRYDSKKRKYSEDESLPPSKRPYIARNPPRLQPYYLKEADDRSSERQHYKVNKQPSERSQVHPKRSPQSYSANNRLKRIRETQQEQRKFPEVQSAPSLFSVDNTLPHASTSASPPQSFPVLNGRNTASQATARPSSLKERLSKIKRSNNSQNNKCQSTTYDTSGGGWFKSIDIEGRSNKRRNEGKPPSTSVGYFAATNQAADQDRVVTRADEESPIRHKNNSVSQNTNFVTSLGFNNSTVNDHTVSSEYVNNVSTSFMQLHSTVVPRNHSFSPNEDQNNEMDWSSFEENEVLSNLQDLRNNFKIGSATPQSAFQEVVARESVEIAHNKTILKTNYIVVDTNIFLSHLDTVKKAMELQINGVDQPTILVPWIVIQELDHIKDGRSENKLSKKAQQAVRFINDCLCSKVNLKAQSVRDAAQQDFASSNFDDGILFCCLQIRERGSRAILLSNDVNLRNKLLSEDFEAYSHDEIFRRLDSYNICSRRTSWFVEDEKESVKIKDIKIRLSHMCTLVIMKEFKAAYGDFWNKMGRANKKVPWSLQDCLELFEKYWIPVFQMHMSRPCIKQIQAFRTNLQDHNGKVNNVEELLNFGLSLCTFLKLAYPPYYSTVAECAVTIQKIYDSN